MLKREQSVFRVCSTTARWAGCPSPGWVCVLPPEIFCTFLKALSVANVDLNLFDISETSVGAVTPAHRLADAEKAVRRAFGMAPAGEEAMEGHEDHLMPAVGPTAETRVAISGQDMTPVPQDNRTVARHF